MERKSYTKKRKTILNLFLLKERLFYLSTYLRMKKTPVIGLLVVFPVLFLINLICHISYSVMYYSYEVIIYLKNRKQFEKNMKTLFFANKREMVLIKKAL